MICPRCKAQLPAGSQSCPNCKAKFVTVSSAANKSAAAPTAAPAQAAATNTFRSYDASSGLALSRFFRACYYIYRFLPLIFTLVSSVLAVFAGIVLTLITGEGIFILISIFGPVLAFLGFFIFSIINSATIARTDATIEILKTLKKL